MEQDTSSRYKKTAPRGTFTCLFCGKVFTKRLSKVRNPQKVFCGNECCGKYREREHLKESMLSEQEFFAESRDPEVQRCGNFIIGKANRMYLSARRYSYAELWQEILIAIWKYGKHAQDTSKGNKYGFYFSAFEHALKEFLRRNDWSVEELSLDEASPIYESSGPLDVRELYLLKEIKQKAEKKKNWRWFWEYYVNNKKASEIAAEYGENMRAVSCAISYIKRTLISKYGQE